MVGDECGGVNGGWGVVVELWGKWEGCRSGAWRCRGECDSPLPATTSRGIGNTRGAFFGVVDTWGACECLAQGINWVKNSKQERGETWLTLLHPVHPIHQ